MGLSYVLCVPVVLVSPPESPFCLTCPIAPRIMLRNSRAERTGRDCEQPSGATATLGRMVGEHVRHGGVCVCVPRVHEYVRAHVIVVDTEAVADSRGAVNGCGDGAGRDGYGRRRVRGPAAAARQQLLPRRSDSTMITSTCSAWAGTRECPGLALFGSEHRGPTVALQRGAERAPACPHALIVRLTVS